MTLLFTLYPCPSLPSLALSLSLSGLLCDSPSCSRAHFQHPTLDTHVYTYSLDIFEDGAAAGLWGGGRRGRGGARERVRVFACTSGAQAPSSRHVLKKT